jgi:hypothetical protein
LAGRQDKTLALSTVWVGDGVRATAGPDRGGQTDGHGNAKMQGIVLPKRFMCCLGIGIVSPGLGV